MNVVHMIYIYICMYNINYIFHQIMLLSQLNVVHILILKISVQSWRMFSPRFWIIIGHVTPMPIEVPRWDLAFLGLKKHPPTCLAAQADFTAVF